MIKYLSILVVVLLFCFSLSGQTEAEILSQANKLFKSEKFVDATPLYLRLLSLSPKNNDYNFHYGTCLLFNGDRKQEALRYLKFATEDPAIDPEAHFYLGKAYHYNYLFNDAVRSYNKFEELVGAKTAENYQVKRLIETCQNGRKLLMNYSEMVVFEKKEIETDKFFRLYDTKDLGGTIIVNSEFQSKIDKKKGHTPLIYFPRNANEIFYASYGDDDTEGKQIYTRKREPSGAWGEPSLVKGSVNTKYDEDYCYKTQDGKYLYFSSKGHNSMGGYDVFRSEYNPSSDSYDEPENMDFAVSSPQDDIFFLVDSKNENGYFASSRQSEEGKLYVYKIRVDKLPAQLSVIAGLYESKVTSPSPKLKVVVENPLGANVGEFYSDDNGQIILSFPTGGNYKYKMSLEGSSESFQANVTLPYKKDIKPIRQNFIHTKENEKEIIRVLDNFDDNVSDREGVLAALFANKANLDPNAEKFDLKSLDGAKEKDELLAQVGASGKNLLEIATELEDKATALHKIEDQAGVVEKKVAFQIQKEINRLKEIDAHLSKNSIAYKNAEVNSAIRAKLLEESKVLLLEKKNTEAKVGNLLEVNTKVQKNNNAYRSLKSNTDAWEAKGSEIKDLLKADKPSEALGVIANNQESIKLAMTTKVEDFATQSSAQIDALSQEIGKLNARKFNYETSSKDLKNNIDYLERFLLEGKTNNPEETKKNIELKKKDLNKILEEIKSIENQLIENNVKKEATAIELSEYLELERKIVPSNAPQLQLVKNQFAELMATPKNPELEFLANEIQNAGLNSTHTTLASVLTKKSVLDALDNTYDNITDHISNDLNMDELSKLKALNEHDNKLINLAKTREKEIQIAWTKEPNKGTVFQKELDILSEILTEKQLQVANRKDEIGNLAANGKNNNATQIEEESNEELIARVSSNYTSQMDALDANSNLSDLDKTKERVRLDEALIKKLNEENTKLKKLSNANPNDQALSSKSGQINELLNEKLQLLDSRKEKITKLEQQIAATNTPTPNTNTNAFADLSSVEQENAIQEKLNWNYEQDKAEIREGTNSAEEKINALIQLDKRSQNQLAIEKAKLNPNNQKAEIEAIERIEQKVKTSLGNNQMSLLALPESKDELIGRIAKNEAASRSALNANKSLSPSEKKKQEIAMDQDLLSVLKNEREKYLRLGQDNPQVPEIMEKANEISTIINSYKESLAQHENELRGIESELAMISNAPEQNGATSQPNTPTTTLNNPAVINPVKTTEPKANPYQRTNVSFVLLPSKEQEKYVVFEANSDYLAAKTVFDELPIPTRKEVEQKVILDENLIFMLEKMRNELNPDTESSKILAIERVIASTQPEIDRNKLKYGITTPEITSPLASKPIDPIASKTTEPVVKPTSPIVTKPTEPVDTKPVEPIASKPTVPDVKPANPVITRPIEPVDAKPTNPIASKSAEPIASQPANNTVSKANPYQRTNVSFVLLPSKEQEKYVVFEANSDYLTEKTAFDELPNPTRKEVEQKVILDENLIFMLEKMRNELNPDTESSKILAIERVIASTQPEIDRNKLKYGITTPVITSPLASKPIDPIASKPTEPDVKTTSPVITKPTDPIVTKPVEPIASKPTEPVVKPANPVITKPTDPIASKPTEPVVKPKNPIITKPTDPVSTKPTDPISSKPSEPVVSKPANPALSAQTNPNPTTIPTESGPNPFQKANVSFVLMPIKEQENWVIYEANRDYLTADTKYDNLPNPTRKEIEEKVILDENLIVALEDLRDRLNPDTETSKILAIERVIDSKQSVIQNSKNKYGITTPEINRPIASKPAITNPSERTKQGITSVEALRKEMLKDEADQMRVVQRTEEGLRNQLRVLTVYENDLLVLDSNYQYLETTKGEVYTTERKLIKDELSTIEFKKRRASISLGELETETEKPQTVLATLKYEDGLLEDLINTENKLRLALSEEVVSLKEARKIEKELFDVIDTRIERENQITAQKVGEEKRTNAEKMTLLKDLSRNSVTERLNVDLTEKRIDQLNTETKLLEQKAKKTKSPFEQSELLEQASGKQQEVANILEESLVDVKVDKLSNGKLSSLLTIEELEQKKRQLLVEESNNEARISALDAQYKKEANTKSQDKLFEQRDGLVQKRKQLNDELALVDKKIASTPKKAEPTLPENAKEKELAYLEERKIAETKAYKDLSRLSNDASFLEREISIQLKSIERDKSEAQELIQKSIAEPNSGLDQQITKKLEQIQVKEAKVEDLKKNLLRTQTELNKILPKDPEQLALINNLLARGVMPMSKSDAVDFVPIPTTGFEIKQNNTAATLKPIVSETPTGLMYRVQVGAFSKPVADDIFNEFTPVSAEKRSNGLIVYMAGYFQGNTKAYDAQKYIRSIGYSDAFVVAYCDGQRISLAEAKRLEETNACKPIQVNQIELQAPAPMDTTKVIVTELDYHKGIGAAQAYPVESKKGLFFTVQLGVYNRPVSKETIKEITPLITKRLPNGQIRYSAGVYVSVEEAFPKRDEARQKGVSDAYITAYYNGERITLTEAEELLRTKGAVIIEKTAVGIVKDVQARIEATNKLEADINEIVNRKMVAGMSLQLVSKKQYDEFPRDVLNRFNSHASFYYDINDKRIKSNLYKHIDDIPQVYFLRNEVDTIFVSDMERLDKVVRKDLRNITFQITEARMGGDLTDFLLRLNYRKEFLMEGKNLKVILHEVPPTKVQAISESLQILKIKSEISEEAR